MAARKMCSTCGKSPARNLLGLCQSCYGAARWKTGFDAGLAEGVSRGRAEGELATLERLRAAGLLLEVPAFHPRPGSPASTGIVMTERQWRQLMQLVHPDLHGGSVASEAATKWLNSIRDKVQP